MCVARHVNFNGFSHRKRGGKKLVGGVKNFGFEKYKHSALICTKNHRKILKTHKYRSKQNLTNFVKISEFREICTDFDRNLYKFRENR